jgi:allophanate hydrolase
MTTGMKDLSLDFHSLSHAFANGLSAVDLVDIVFDRIEACGDPGIFITRADRESVRAAARALGPRSAAKPLWGIPFAVKDNIDVVGLPTTAGCPAFAFAPGESASTVERLVTAGALVIGKTNLDQFAAGLVGVRTPYPAPKNPFDPALVPGGSSSGSAVAVARGLVSFALGTDTAGSGRVPAALNNLVGLKPTVGAVPTRGVVPACASLDCVSIFALTVDDAWAVYQAMAGLDPRDAFSRSVPVGAIGASLPKLRVGVPDSASRRFSGDTESEAAFDRALDDLVAQGATLVPVDLSPFFEAASLLYQGPFVAERYEAIRPMLETRAGDILPVTRGIIESATKFSAADAFGGIYALRELQRVTKPIWSAIDALVVPTFPKPRRVAELEADPIGPNSDLGTYTNFVNLLDLCALAVPGRFRGDGLPAGITFIAPAGRDALLATMGAAFHAATGAPLGATGAPQPPVPQRPVRADETTIEIVVVGAHLSGMALNHELLSNGGRFLREAMTRSAYRLYSLPGGPPRRPGLLRVGEQGHAIACEVWALPPDGFGRFVAGIPSPLAIGTLHLDDGTSPKGFLVEHEATIGAEDISHFGGWRAFIQARAA